MLKVTAKQGLKPEREPQLDAMTEAKVEENYKMIAKEERGVQVEVTGKLQVMLMGKGKLKRERQQKVNLPNQGGGRKQQ